MVATASEIVATSPDRTTAKDRSLDRWFYASVALLFFITVLLGFVPNSIEKINAVAARQMPRAAGATSAMQS